MKSNLAVLLAKKKNLDEKYKVCVEIEIYSQILKAILGEVDISRLCTVECVKELFHSMNLMQGVVNT